MIWIWRCVVQATREPTFPKIYIRAASCCWRDGWEKNKTWGNYTCCLSRRGWNESKTRASSNRRWRNANKKWEMPRLFPTKWKVRFDIIVRVCRRERQRFTSSSYGHHRRHLAMILRVAESKSENKNKKPYFMSLQSFSSHYASLGGEGEEEIFKKWWEKLFIFVFVFAFIFLYPSFLSSSSSFVFICRRLFCFVVFGNHWATWAGW